MREIRSRLDDIGSPDAEPGSEEWAKNLRVRFCAAIADDKFSHQRLSRLLLSLTELKGYAVLTGPDGKPFKTIEEFCETPPPHGLGMSLPILLGTIEYRRTLQQRGRPKKEEKPYHDKVFRVEQYGAGTAYLQARLDRDRPDIAKRLERGEIRSTRAAAIEAGIVKVRKVVSVPLDIEKAVVVLRRHFDVDELRRLL